MLRVRDIMTREIVTVSPELSVRDAMALLSSRHISGAPVMTNNRVIGVVSLTDLVELASELSGVPTLRLDNTDWAELEDPLAWVDEGVPTATYYAELWDDSGVEASERMAEPEGPEWNMLEEHTVAEAMNRTVAALTPEVSVQAAAELMRRAGIHRLLVMQDAALVGLVSTKDISDAVADGRIAFRARAAGRSGRDLAHG